MDRLWRKRQPAPAEVSRASPVSLLWQEARPQVQIIFAIRFWVGVSVGLRHQGSVATGTYASAVAWVAVTLSIYLINGYADQAEDSRNGSPRPLAADQLHPGLVLRTAAALGMGGCLLLVAGDRPAGAVLGLLMMALGWMYSIGPAPLKCTVVGTAVASAGGGLLTYSAGCVSTGVVPHIRDMAFVALLSLWMAVAGASKDLSDVPGDMAAGRRTLPVILGIRRAAAVIAIGSATLGVAAVVLAGSRHGVVLPALAFTAGTVVVVLRLLRLSPDTDRNCLRRPYRAFMATQYGANIAMLTTCALRLQG